MYYSIFLLGFCLFNALTSYAQTVPSLPCLPKVETIWRNSTDPNYAVYATGQAIFRDRAPLAVVFPQTATDVSKTVICALSKGVTPVARSGGHSYEGLSSLNDTVVIDFSQMATMSVVDDSKGLVRASAGLRLGNLYAGLYDHNPSWTFPAGVCPSVGLGGHIAAGGYGTLARKFGVGADNVVAATVVLADGRIVKADANTNADLFYAIRGGGGGSYGFVVDLTLRAAQVTENYVAKVTYPNVDDAAKVVETWYNWVSGPLSKRNASIPTTGKTFDGWAVNMQMNLFKDGPLSFGVRYTPSTPSSVEEFTAILASSGMTDTSKFAWKWDSPPAKVNNLVAQSFSDGQPATLSDDEARAFLAVPQRQTDVNWKDRSRLKSEYVRGKLNPAFYATVQDVLKQASNVSPWSMIQLEAYGGMINAAAASTNGFAHRGNTQFVIQYGLYFSKTLPDPTIPAGLSWLTNTENAFKPFVSGEHYQGYVDLDVSPQSFYGQHYPKLVRIKQKYDPGNVLWSDLVPPKTSKIWFGPTYLH